MRVLVCVKRVPDVAGEVMLTADEQAVDARHVGYTVSNHESSAVELAIRIADATGGSVTLLTVGPGDAVEQLRSMLALGCHAATLVEADPVALGPADVAREIAAVVEDHAANEAGYDLVLLGNDAADSGDFQVGIRLAYALGWPVVNGVSVVETADGSAITRGDGPDGEETFSRAAARGGHGAGGRRRAALPEPQGPDGGQEDRDRDPAARGASRRARPG